MPPIEKFYSFNHNNPGKITVSWEFVVTKCNVALNTCWLTDIFSTIKLPL